MLSTTAYESRKTDFLAYKDTLVKEPSGDVKKEYYVGCNDRSDWVFIHEELMKDGSLEDNIPDDSCDCANDCLHSDTRGVYLLTNTEATALRNHAKVTYVHINAAAYPGTYMDNPDDVAGASGGKDIKIGDDKRPVRKIPQNEQPLYNYADGEILTDEFENPLVTEVDTFYLPSATAKNSSSVVFDDENDDYVDTVHSFVGFETGMVALYGNLDVRINTNIDDEATILQADGTSVTGIKTEVELLDGTFVAWHDPHVVSGISSVGIGTTGSYTKYTERDGSLPSHFALVRSNTDQTTGLTTNSYNDAKLYVDASISQVYTLGARSGSRVIGAKLPPTTTISGITHNSRILLSHNANEFRFDRYTGTVKHQRDYTTAYIPASPGADLLNRGSWQLKRMQHKVDPWQAINDNTIIEDRIMQTGDGTDVDIIVGDQDMWFGHIEFQNNLGGPAGYKGGNVLPGNGTCDVLDLVLDAPLYLDPDWFGTDNVPGNPGYHSTYASLGLPASKIITRWDGTKVPHEGWARRWWMEASARSHEADIVLLPNTASEVTIAGGFSTTFPDFGSITISTSYTRAACNGSNTAYKTGTGFHGTPCASQAYGRQYGWAYNANKWFVSAYGAGSLGWENYFDITKIFHRYKPINPDLGTKDPTISSNSWGHRWAPPTSGFYWHRPANPDGVSGTSYSSLPAFLSYFTGDGYNRKVMPYDAHAALDAGKELIDEGVIFVCASGNNNQKLVQATHPDYNNYHHNVNNTALTSATEATPYTSMSGANFIRTVNRPGYPQQIGKYVDGTTSKDVYRTIAIGALDNDHDANGKERKVSYTNMGNAVDVFAPADETLAACDNQSGSRINRYDAYYTIGGTQSAESEDRSFNGTSAACPIAAGLIAAKVQYNRNWGWSDVKAWFRESNTEQSSDDFYLGTEATTATDVTNWGDFANLHGAPPRVIWDSMSAGETWHFREPVQIRKSEQKNKTANVVWRVEEQFKETSEVSSTLLGIPRAETQLSLFSNVSSYGIDTDDFESWSWSTGSSNYEWETRRNRLYGERYATKVSEETQESGIKIASFPAPYSYPFGPKFERVGLYRPTTFEQYKDFIQMGNDLHQIFNGLDDNHNVKSPAVTTYYDHTNAQRDFSNYGSYFRESFLSIRDAKVDITQTPIDVDYASGITTSFAAVDTWTDTWRKLNNNDLTIPNTDIKIGLREARQILENNYKDDNETNFSAPAATRPGYDGGLRRTVQLQSRKVFRYQPGRISGFTFGLRASKGKTAGYTNEWGISNPTDQYLFRIRSGFLKIIRRSTISLTNSPFAIPENLEESVINATDVAHPYDSVDPNSATGDSLRYFELEIPQENFNGDRLDGNGPSGYVINPEAVTMYKIEFGWYGAIGVRFYAYIPTGNNDARWVVLHTMVIENQLGQPCLQDSYFRFVYNINVTAPSTVNEPMFVYKYGASYYIDGGDEGTSQVYSASTPIKKITGIGTEALMGITPKDYIVNSVGTKIENRKLILPTRLQISSSQLAEIKTVVCKGCPGFGHVHTPGASTGSNARTIPSGDDGVTLLSTGDKIEAKGTSYFTIKDIDAKVISPTINNCYIQSLDQETSPGSGQYEVAVLKGFTSVSGLGVSERKINDYPVWDDVVGAVGINTSGQDHPHPIKLSAMGGIVASDFKLNGSKIAVQFVNPSPRDGYGHWADFSIGLTNCVPQVTAPDILTGWKTPGGSDIVDPILSGVTTSVLPQEKMIEGRYTHSWASIDGEGVEQGEAWWPTQPSMPMGIDYRIPNVPSPAPGHCSRITFEVENSFNVENMEYLTTYPPDNTQPAGTPPHFLQVKGDLDPTILYDGGEVTIISNGTPTNSGKTYVGAAGSYFKYDAQANENVKYSWIRISGDISAFGTTGISAVFRPIKTDAEGLPTTRKIFTYNPFPLYLVAKMRDNASFNNLSIKEEIGDFDRTITPKLYKPLDTSTSITFAKNPQNVAQADPDDAPTHFDEIERLCSARVDVQNEQKLRQESSNSKVIDTVYIGAGETKSLDLTKIFGPDRAVITPDNNNTEATFFVATRVDGINSESDIQMSLNFREQ